MDMRKGDGKGNGHQLHLPHTKVAEAAHNVVLNGTGMMPPAAAQELAKQEAKEVPVARPEKKIDRLDRNQYLDVVDWMRRGHAELLAHPTTLTELARRATMDLGLGVTSSVIGEILDKTGYREQFKPAVLQGVRGEPTTRMIARCVRQLYEMWGEPVPADLLAYTQHQKPEQV